MLRKIIYFILFVNFTLQCMESTKIEDKDLPCILYLTDKSTQGLNVALIRLIKEIKDPSKDSFSALSHLQGYMKEYMASIESSLLFCDYEDQTIAFFENYKNKNMRVFFATNDIERFKHTHRNKKQRHFPFPDTKKNILSTNPFAQEIQSAPHKLVRLDEDPNNNNVSKLHNFAFSEKEQEKWKKIIESAYEKRKSTVLEMLQEEQLEEEQLNQLRVLYKEKLKGSQRIQPSTDCLLPIYTVTEEKL